MKTKFKKIGILTSILFLILMIDYGTTIIGINFFGLSETNPLFAYLYNLGLVGWIISPFISLILLFLLSYITINLSQFLYKKWEPTNNKKVLKYINYLLPLVVIIIFCIVETFTILNNIKLILG